MKILVWGCGNMGSALALGLRRALPKASIDCWNPNIEKAQELAKKVAGEVFQRMDEGFSRFDVIILGCKPQKLKQASESLKGKLARHALIVSPLAATSIEQLKESFTLTRVLRVMPNLQIAQGSGLILWGASGVESEEEKQWATHFAKLGEAYFLSEELIDLYTLHAGCSPAFIYYWMEKAGQFALKHGGDAQLAKLLLLQSWKGTLNNLATVPEQDLAMKIKEVASAGGIAEACLRAFESASPQYIDQAFEAGLTRIKELYS